MSKEEVKFDSFGLLPSLRAGVAALGFETPTPIQAEAVPPLLEGRDVIGRARTGSGKTAAFGLPLLNREFGRNGVQGLVLAPTRELAIQVARSLEEYASETQTRIVTIYGGASYDPQIRGLKRGANVVVGTPGRVIDLMDRGVLKVGNVEFFVLDEADEMLRMGFIEEVEKVLGQLPEKRQIALFSATMPKEIRRVAERYLNDPLHIQVEEGPLTVSHIDQTIVRVKHRDKDQALLRLLAGHESEGTLVFARTRVRCADAAALLIKQGLTAAALHGDMSQSARESVLKRLRNKDLDVVVATDVAARGLDVEHLTHVINYDIPDAAETYVHRIGRTGRAGRKGSAISLVTPRERTRIQNFQRELKVRIPEAQLPSDDDIRALRRRTILDQLKEQFDDPKTQWVKAWLLKVVVREDFAIEDLAAAAIRLLEKEAHIDVDDMVPVEAQHEVKGEINECEVVLSLGRRDGLRPADVVGLFSNELGIPANKIGRISMGSQRIFVGLPIDVAQFLLRERNSVEIRGKEARINMNPKSEAGGSRERGEDSPRGHRPRPKKALRRGRTAPPQGRDSSGDDKPKSKKPRKGPKKGGKKSGKK